MHHHTVNLEGLLASHTRLEPHLPHALRDLRADWAQRTGFHPRGDAAFAWAERLFMLHRYAYVGNNPVNSSTVPSLRSGLRLRPGPLQVRTCIMFSPKL